MSDKAYLIATGIPTLIYAGFLLPGMYCGIDIRDTAMFSYFIVFLCAYCIACIVYAVSKQKRKNKPSGKAHAGSNTCMKSKEKIL